MKKPFLFLVLIFLFSCGNNENKNSSEDGAVAVEKTKKVESENSSDPPDDYAEDVFPNLDEEVFPVEFELKTYYIEPSSAYHDTDELPKIKQKEEWLGFYKNDAGEMELKTVKMTFKRVFDDMVDSDKKRPTGIEPIPSDDVNCEFVLNPIGGMKPKKLVSLLPNTESFLPFGQKTIKSNEVVYRIYATGDKVMENDQEGIRNYQLFVESKDKNGVKKTQLLMQVPTFGKDGPPSIRIVIASYLDDDSIPDFILTNESRTYVYLSKFASESEIVRVVGSDVLPSGC